MRLVFLCCRAFSIQFQCFRSALYDHMRHGSDHDHVNTDGCLPAHVHKCVSKAVLPPSPTASLTCGVYIFPAALLAVSVAFENLFLTKGNFHGAIQAA